MIGCRARAARGVGYEREKARRKAGVDWLTSMIALRFSTSTSPIMYASLTECGTKHGTVSAGPSSRVRLWSHTETGNGREGTYSQDRQNCGAARRGGEERASLADVDRDYAHAREGWRGGAKRT